MIRYGSVRGKVLTLASLQSAITADATGHKDEDVRKAVAGWLGKAKSRTTQLIAAGAYIDLPKWNKLPVAKKAGLQRPIALEWASVKYLFMEVQNEKCAYCERKLAARGQGGAAEHDLEHFRPKNPVKKWPAPAEIKFPTGGPSTTGYFWLAFHLLNYCTACSKCNSGLKSNYFPVAGPRGSCPTEPGGAFHAAERPLLIYPLGKVDDDPEDVIRFRGITALPPHLDPLLPVRGDADDHLSRRARVTIAFFDLNGRPELLWGRAERLRELEKSLAALNDLGASGEQRAAAQDDIRRLTDGYSEHTACVRGMVRLYQADPQVAREYFRAVRDYLNSKTPASYFERAGRIVSGPPAAPNQGSPT
jgi:hypothetical protein